LEFLSVRPPLRFDWSGEGFVFNRHEKTTRFRFNLTGAQAGQVVTRRVAIQGPGVAKAAMLAKYFYEGNSNGL